ncbi:MAG: mechanosensitive ion channel family protein [Chloroflexi bacterium]|nr:mechanosensitive ion channel family protein [Chloroflexota bacterium]
MQHSFRAVLVVALAWALVMLLERAAPPLLDVATRWDRRSHPPEDAQRRVHTVGTVAVTTLRVIIGAVALFTLLAEVGVNVTPLLAGLSLAGVAVGLGFQNLVKDVVSGSVILAEDQFRVGDIVQVATLRGTVEAVNLRRTVLRDADGVVHSVPNGQILLSSNYTRGFARVNLDLRVSYAADLDQAISLLNEVGQQIAGDPELGGMFLEPPSFRRVEALEENAVVLRITGMVRPGRQWDAAGELRRRLLNTFRAAGIPLHNTPAAAPAATPAIEAAPPVPAAPPIPPALLITPAPPQPPTTPVP